MLEALTCEEILQAFEGNRIGGGKINASFSPMGAAWDKSKALFQGTKAKLKKLTNETGLKQRWTQKYTGTYN